MAMACELCWKVVAPGEYSVGSYGEGNHTAVIACRECVAKSIANHNIDREKLRKWLKDRADRYAEYLAEERETPGTYEPDENADHKAKMLELWDTIQDIDREFNLLKAE